ncbi:MULTISPECIES: cytosine permease [unclassified Acidiplasma]|uniref:purine-cytosine permease family protein n=1 Tax=unclassified Acidiplasma TaxID=2641301 RepID=UPI0009E429F4|nr:MULTISPECIES: cytosine permease [unclassified Acidiplasma]WMT55291.1 MAG: cytosine permease [Acidiplasma sp.]
MEEGLEADESIESGFDDSSGMAVPKSMRKSYFNTFMVLNASFAAIAVVFGGSVLGSGLSFADAIIVVLIASTILAIIGSGSGYISANSGGSTYLNWRYGFGRIPSKIIGVILILITTGIGWYAYETWFFGIIMSEIFPSGYLHSIWFDTLWGGILMILMTYVGYRALSFITYTAFPQHVWLLLVGFFAALALVHSGSSIWSISPKTPFSMSTGITDAVGLYIAGALIAGDITRFAKNGKTAVTAWTAHMYIFYPMLILGGTALVLVTGSGIVTAAMLSIGLGIAVLLIIILGQLAINAANLYSGSLSFVNFLRIKRTQAAIISGIIGTAVATWLGFTSGTSLAPFESFLGYLGDFLPAAAGVVFADYFIKKPLINGIKDMKERYTFNRNSKYPEYNINGILSLIFGSLIGLFVPYGIGAINSILSAFLLYLLIAYLAMKFNFNYEIGQYEHYKIETETKTFEKELHKNEIR